MRGNEQLAYINKGRLKLILRANLNKQLMVKIRPLLINEWLKLDSNFNICLTVTTDIFDLLLFIKVTEDKNLIKTFGSKKVAENYLRKHMSEYYKQCWLDSSLTQFQKCWRHIVDSWNRHTDQLSETGQCKSNVSEHRVELALSIHQR